MIRLHINLLIKKNNGYSFLELMMVILIGSMLSLITVNFFQYQNRTFFYLLSLIKTQKNANIILSMLDYDIKNSGYLGCLSKQYFYNRNKQFITIYNLERIEEFEKNENNKNVNLNSFYIGDKKLPLLKINYSDHLKIAKYYSRNEILVDNDIYYHKNDTVILSNCLNYQENKIEKIIYFSNSIIIKFKENILFSDKYPIFISKLHEYFYFLTKTKSEAGYSLHRKDLLQSSYLPDSIINNVNYFLLKEDNRDKKINIYFILESEHPFFIKGKNYNFKNVNIKIISNYLLYFYQAKINYVNYNKL